MPPTSGSARAAAVAAVAVPAAVAAIMVATRWSHAALWRDEYATAMYASLAPASLLRATAHVDGLLAPYYLLIHALSPFTGLGDGMRWVSALAFVGTAGTIALTAKRWFGGVAGLTAGLAFAVGAAGIVAGANARPYALSVLAVSVAVLSLDLTRTARHPAAGWIGFSLAGLAAVVLQPLAALPLALTVILPVWTRPPRRPVIVWLIASVPWVAAAALLLVLGSGQSGQLSWLASVDVRDAVQTLAGALSLSPDRAVLLDAAVLVIFVFVGALILARGPRDWRGPLAFALSLALGPTVVLFTASVLVRPILTERYVLWSALGAALVIGASIGRLRLPRRGWDVLGAFAALVLFVVAGVQGVVTATHVVRGDDFPTLASEVGSSARPGDLLVVVQRYEQGGVAYGFAQASGDDAYRDEILRTIPAGPAPVLDVRRIQSVSPFRSVAVARSSPAELSSTMWIVSIWPPTREDASHLDPRIAECLSRATPSTGREIHGSWLYEIPCAA